MLKKLFRLTVVSTILSLTFMCVSCKSNESASFSKIKQIQISDVVNLEQIYAGEKTYDSWPKSTVFMRFLPGNIIEMTNSNDFRDIVDTFKITSFLGDPDNGVYEVQYKYTSIKITLRQQRVVDAGNKGNLEDKEIWGIEDIPSTIKNWTLNEAKDISSIIKPFKKRVFTMKLTISKDKRYVSVLEDGESVEETIDLTLQ